MKKKNLVRVMLTGVLGTSLVFTPLVGQAGATTDTQEPTNVLVTMAKNKFKDVPSGAFAYKAIDDLTVAL